MYNSSTSMHLNYIIKIYYILRYMYILHYQGTVHVYFISLSRHIKRSKKTKMIRWMNIHFFYFHDRVLFHVNLFSTNHLNAYWCQIGTIFSCKNSIIPHSLPMIRLIVVIVHGVKRPTTRREKKKKKKIIHFFRVRVQKKIKINEIEQS